MINSAMEIIKAIGPIVGGVTALATLIQIAYKVKEVIYELKLKDEHFSVRFERLDNKIDRIAESTNRFLDLTTSRMEAFENRLLEVETKK